MTMLTVLDCNYMCSSDVILEEEDVVLTCFKCRMMCYDYADNDDVRGFARVGFSL